ncbi:flavin monoamine oxidase family protein [Sorangium sp. So ce118]
MRSPERRFSLPHLTGTYNELEALYTRLLRKGLPKTDRPQSIGIVGAGISGLISGWLLAAAGHRVSIFEASDRIGGRIKTVREPFSDDNYAEVGAMRIPSFYKLTLEAIERFRLPTNVFINANPDGRDWVLVNGVRQRRSEYQRTNGEDLGYPLLDVERGMTADVLLAKACAAIATYVGNEHLEGFRTNRWADVVAKYGEMSVREYLKSVTFYSEAAIEFIEVFNGLDSRSDQSIIQQLVEINDHAPSVQYFEITGGMDLLPRAVETAVRELGVSVRLGKRLVAIEQNTDSAKLVFIEDGDTSLNPATHGETFDRVITTVPFSGFRYVVVTPSLSHDKRKTIRELHYDSSTKIVMQFRERFWETRDGIYGGGSITDRPSRFLYYPSHGYDRPSGVIITSYTWGDPARTWDSLSTDDQIRNSLNDVAAVHGDYVRDLFDVGYVQSWQKDHYAYGEAAMFYPGQLAELQPAISTAEGRIHFAGEHTSLKHAWIEGAIESAIRVALEIMGGV